MKSPALLDLALAAVADAARVCRAAQAAIADGRLTKADASPVTVADFAAQAIVNLRLAVGTPGVPIVGEEDADALRAPANSALRQKVVDWVRVVEPQATERQILAAIDRGGASGGANGRFWTLDPIDGTKGFLRGEQYAVALALIEDGQIQLGVLGCPNLDANADQRGALFAAARGEGATARPLDGGPVVAIRVDGTTDPRRARFCESVESGHSAHDWSAAIAARLGVAEPPYRIDSQCKYAAVARGDAAIYLRLPTRADYVEKIWDHAAGAAIIEAAGGRVTDISGRPLDFSLGRRLEHNQGIAATNGHLHDAVLTAIADARAAS
ncbi:MAG: 3'(2'),5'-bisphosphate nucleotidase [Myxococcales bacterium]|nr:3'(2'),5'-bisphosphate nucleotidase [Myxococcales bacterium]